MDDPIQQENIPNIIDLKAFAINCAISAGAPADRLVDVSREIFCFLIGDKPTADASPVQTLADLKKKYVPQTFSQEYLNEPSGDKNSGVGGEIKPPPRTQEPPVEKISAPCQQPSARQQSDAAAKEKFTDERLKPFQIEILSVLTTMFLSTNRPVNYKDLCHRFKTYPSRNIAQNLRFLKKEKFVSQSEVSGERFIKPLIDVYGKKIVPAEVYKENGHEIRKMPAKYADGFVPFDHGGL